LIYNVVDEILVCKIRIEFKNNKRMYVSKHLNRVWCHKHLLDIIPQC